MFTCYLAVAGLALSAADKQPIEVDPSQFLKTEREASVTRRLLASEISDYFRTADTSTGILVTIKPPEKQPAEEDVDDLARRIVPITLAIQRCKDIRVELRENAGQGSSLRATLVRDAMVANGVPAESIKIASEPGPANAGIPSVSALLDGNSIRKAEAGGGEPAHVTALLTLR